MANEADIALAALIIGLSALLIATGQLIQQLFSTADGYRRCQASVIGPWSRQTRLVWHWSQFRFETKFTTPDIVLFERRSHHLGAKGLENFKHKNKKVIDLNCPNLPTELRETVTPIREDSGDQPLGDMVTWTLLLRQLHRLQGRWYQAYQPNLLPSTDPNHIVAYGTRISIVYQERTWDLLPPDIIRPMASSRLGTIIVLSLRLGMQWENIDISNGAMRAEGNGHTLLSTIIRGLGIAFQYSFNSEADCNRNGPSLFHKSGFKSKILIPRRSTDKMSCGIIPSTGFDIPDIPLCGKNIAEGAILLSAALSHLNVQRSTISRITAHEKLEKMQQINDFVSPVGFPIHDMIALLAPFLPLKGSSNTRIAYPIQASVTLSAFYFPEPREALFCRLRDHCRLQDPAETHLRQVFTSLQGLVDRYESDYYCRWDEAIVNDASAPMEAKLGFIDNLRVIHAWTTTYFKSIEQRLKFVDLVAAHITLATDAAFESFEKHINSLNQSPQAYWADTGYIYIDHLPSLCDELRPKLQSASAEDDNSFIEEAWWTLVLRGIVWRMSVDISWGDILVPSKLYYDQTPVYIM
ncbi:uncharacterized protein A1O9_10871 [Exophiala aquamarina CBS 119918]|uniref:Uncharacterized protein n=1 Tax=Exophiala aquamarina CBS 119918 TaxID=1182545 RepID=A0A072PBL5_9EURO|nr:uncharacterized protein A1O9_10871 [Exophiala aquamarina CBS 119918]KEF52965.1 hypothetical protein A1O9_10871 [Exophiala aquamarina CBS 119918]